MLGERLYAPALDAYGQMALDEAVLDEAEGEALLLRFYEWEGGPRDRMHPHGATFGYFQPYEEAVRGLESRGIAVVFPVARRSTGGGLVIHDADLTFSLVFPWSRLASPSLIYKDLHRGIHLGLKAQGLASRLWSPPTPGKGPMADCFAGPSPMDLVHEDGTKFLGGALRRRKGLGLYQGSLRPEGFRTTYPILIKAVVDGLSLEWQTAFPMGEANQELLEKAERLRSERFATDAWNRKR